MPTETLTSTRLRRLAECRPSHGRVLSVFMDLDPTRFAAPPAKASAIASIVDDARRRIEACSGELEHDEHQALRRDLDRVDDALNAPDLAVGGVQGIAIYACEICGLFEVVKLPHPLETRVAIERTAQVEPLAPLTSEERWCVVLANRRTGRIMRGTPQSLEETRRVDDDVRGQHDQGGWSQANYQRSVEKEKDDHVRRVASEVFASFKRVPFDRLLLVVPEELHNELERELHPYLRDRVAGRLALDVEVATPDDVRRAAAPIVEDFARRRERDALQRLHAGLARGDRASAGLEDVIAALNEQRVEMLLIEDGFHAPGGIDPTTGTLLPDGAREAPHNGAPVEPRTDVVEAAIEKAFEQNAGVLVIRDLPDLGPLGHIAALLRF